MPRVKLKQPFHFLDNYVMVETERALVAAGVPVPEMLPSIVWVVCRACEPTATPAIRRLTPAWRDYLVRYPDHEKAFADFCAADPAHAARVLRAVYSGVESLAGPSGEAHVIRWLLDHNSLPQPVSTWQRLWTHELEAGQIAALLGVGTEVVKKARQKLAKGK